MSKPGDPRLADLLNSADPNEGKTKVGIIGYPCDLAVIRSKGQPGAKRAPEVVRNLLPKLGPLVNPEFDIDIRSLSFTDLGDVNIVESLEENHVALTKKTQQALDDGYITIVMGGGKDQSFSNAKALMNNIGSGRIGVVTVDAHMDVRPLINGRLAHWSSCRRQMLLDKTFQNGGKLCEFALQGNQGSAEHAQFIRDHGGDIKWLRQVRKEASIEFAKVLESFGDRDIYLAVDIDFIQGSDCPGCNVPAVIGLTAQDALDICFEAGKNPKTRVFDISEFNPDIEEKRTAALVCNMIYYFLMGVASR